MSEDLSSLDTIAACNEGFELEIIHPTSGKGMGGFITVVGTDSDLFREYNNELTNLRIRENALATRAGKDLPIPTVEDRYLEGTKMLAACTIGFRDITFEKQELEFTQANAIKLYTKIPAIRRQVDKAIADISNFMPG